MASDVNGRLLESWANCSPTVSASDISLPVLIRWKWGELVLLPNQANGGWYYVYRRNSVQGKFCVVRLRGLKVICTCQTLGGALCACDEFNELKRGGK